jgi:hypothetical protein
MLGNKRGAFGCHERIWKRGNSRPMRLTVVRRACSANGHWQFLGKRTSQFEGGNPGGEVQTEPIRRGQPWRRGSNRVQSVEETSLDESFGWKFQGQLWGGSSRGEFAEADFAGSIHEPIRRGQLWRRGSTECIQWRRLRWTSLSGGSFRGNSGAEVRGVSSTRPNLQGVLNRMGPPGATLETLFTPIFGFASAGSRINPLSPGRYLSILIRSSCCGFHEWIGGGNLDDLFNG